jgi:Spy/CpxP family protein refolding chaperone
MNRKWKISLYLAAIFVAGVVTGMFISYQLVRRMMPTQERMVGRWCGELQSKLNLTPEQMQKIRPIVNDVVTDFRNDLSRGMLLSLSNCNARVVLELMPEQKAKFEQIQKEQEEFIRSRIGGETSSPPKNP